MQLLNAIGHSLRKNRNEKSTVKERNEVWEASAPVVQLAESIQDVYSNKATKHWGTFETDEVSYPFQRVLRDHLSGVTPEFKQ